jgi:hypothetical protein
LAAREGRTEGKRLQISEVYQKRLQISTKKQERFRFYPNKNKDFAKMNAKNRKKDFDFETLKKRTPKISRFRPKIASLS